MVCYNNEYYYELPTDKKPTRFWVEYNGKYVADYKSVLACLKFINRKGLQDDFDNTLRIVDNNGDMYNTISGNKLDYII